MPRFTRWNPQIGGSVEGILLFFSGANESDIVVFLKTESDYLVMPPEAAEILQFLRDAEGSHIRIEATADGFEVTTPRKKPMIDADETQPIDRKRSSRPSA